jgi:hypothetical protein
MNNALVGLPLALTLILAGCQTATGPAATGGATPGAGSGQEAGAPTDDEVKATLVSSLSCAGPDVPNPGGFVHCAAVDTYGFEAIQRHGRLCQVINRVKTPTYPITTVVHMTAHYTGGYSDQSFTSPAADAAPDSRTFMMVYSEYHHSWTLNNVAPLSYAGPC